MKKALAELKAIRDLHQSGQLESAKTAYLQFLKKNPKNIEALHSLGILYAQQENFSEAIPYLEKASKLQPENLAISLHLANILKFQGLFSQAALILEKALEKDPYFTPGLNNLGTVYYAQGKLPEAVKCYRAAIEKNPDFVDAYYNLGLALAKLNSFDEAELAYEALLKLAPEHVAARFHLACNLMQQNKLNDAIKSFLEIEKSHPEHFETQTNLATCFLKQGDLNEARIHYLKALELSPNDIQVLYNLGVIHTQLDNIDIAIQYYQRATQLNPNDFALHNNLGTAFLAKQHVGFALKHFQEALRIQPGNKTIQHIIQFLSQHQHLLSSPPDYIKTLFDAYADHYEAHLLNALDYQLHNLFLTEITQLNLKPHSLATLDLGCGTGLCGQIVKPFAESLIGVDLSPKMLEVAAQKNIYTQLITEDFQVFLSDKNACYDLIMAGDVLVYLGDLENLFAKINFALKSHGYFLFNTEITEDKDFKMNQSGRFAHHRNYLERCIKQQGFKIVSYKEVVTRLQNNEPVSGHLYVVQK